MDPPELIVEGAIENHIKMIHEFKVLFIFIF